MAQKSALLSRGRLIRILALGSLCVVLPACGAGSRVSARLEQMKAHWQTLIDGLFPGKAAKPTTSPQAQASAAADPALDSEKAKIAKANAEILNEMLTVVLMQEPKDRSLFGNYVDSLNQGASLEGVYNGFSHSSYYRQLENKVLGATPAALDFFVSEMLALMKDEKDAGPLTEDAGRPLAVPVNPAEDEGYDIVKYPGAGGTKPGASPAPKGSPTEVEIRAKFKYSSIFTLKRALGDEALKVIADKKSVAEDLANWYAKETLRLIDTQVDFGLALRNKRDEKFHHDWAMSFSQDRLTWEVLNRLHRVLNAKQQSQSPAPQKQKA